MVDAASVAEIWRQHEHRLRCYAVRVLRDYDDGAVTHAEDAVAQAFAWLLGEIRAGEAPSTECHAIGALYRATRNFAMQALVTNGVVVESHVKTVKSMPTSFFAVPARDELASAEQLAELVRAMRHLTPRERDVFLRCDLRGDCAAEVADELQMKKPQVSLTLWKARNRIAWHLEHGDRPFYAREASGLRRGMVQQAVRTEVDVLRDKMASNRRRYHARKLEAALS